MNAKIRKARKSSGDPPAVPPLAQLEAEQERDTKSLSELQARIWARKRLINAAKEYQQLSGHKVRRARKGPAAQKGHAKLEPAAVPDAQPTDLSPAARKGSGSMGIVMDLLRDNPSGLTAADMKKKAADNPQAPASLTAHGQYIYFVLDTLRKRGEVVNENGTWKIAKSQAANERHEVRH